MWHPSHTLPLQKTLSQDHTSYTPITPDPYCFFLSIIIFTVIAPLYHLYRPLPPRAPQLTTLLHCSPPLDRFVILGDSHGRGTAPRVMDGPRSDYTPRECKAPTLLCDKSTPPTPPPHPPASLHLFTRHYFALKWNRSSTCWRCWRKLIPEGIRDIFTDDRC